MSAPHDFSDKGFSTRAIHAGQHPDPVTGAVCVPISLATTYAQSSPGVPMGRDSGYSYGKGFEYSRTGNPTRAAFEQCVAACEKGKHCCAWASGLAATGALMHLLKSGDHVVSVDDVYGGTQRYFRKICAPTYNLDFSFVDFNKEGELEGAITEKTKMVWLETPTNPTLKITDIRRVAEVAKQHNLLLVVDNTFMSPYFQNPLELGADIVLHSVTKFIGGHSDVVMGVTVTRSDDIDERLRFIQNGMGSVPAPFDCYMALRGLKTLGVRMRQHEANATALAKFLEEHPGVEKVVYPGLPSHPQHEVAKAQMRGYGGMITFYVKGGLEAARKFMENVEIFTLAESLGAVESLCESPAIMTHASVPAEHRAKLNISDSLIRLSVGIEEQEDLLEDVKNALAAAAAAQ